MRITQSCPACLKNLELTSEFKIGAEIIRSFKCGHSFSDSVLQFDASQFDFHSVDNTKEAREYQKVGVEFIHSAGFNCVIGDQMRLGKTPQSLLALKNSPEHFPALIIVRAANLFQWTREFKTWVTPELWGIYTIQGTKGFIPPGFKAYIISMDTFSRKGVMEYLLAFGFKLVIVDEAHSFKNTDSNRSQALVAFLKDINRADLTHEVPFTCMMCKHTWNETVTVKVNTMEAGKQVKKTTYCPACKAQVSQSAGAHVKVRRNCDCTLLTGTAIKNRADEWFVPLNIVAPERFPSLSHFQNEWLTQNDKGKYTRVKPWKLEEFKKLITPFVLRREKEDVYTDIPKLNRTFTMIQIDDERIKKAYNKVLDELEMKMLDKPNLSFWDSIGELQRLRQITGMAKVPFITDYAETLLMDSDKAKLAIGAHHYAVLDNLKLQLAQFGTIAIDGRTRPEEKDRLAHKYFQGAPEQIAVLSILACKEGMEMPYVDYALVIEREFTSTDEEQFEYRFYNPDKGYLEAKGINREKVTNIEYVVANGTTDQFFHEMVEEKRAIFGETISNNWSIDTDSSSWKNLLERTVSNRL